MTIRRKMKRVVPILIAFIIGISTTVGATTVFNSKDITYSSDKTSKTNVKDSLDELYSKVGKCPEGQWCYKEPMTLADKVELGDYISMTPTKPPYTPPSELTGCMNDENCTQNTINPSELNLWRVIRKNSDGTIDVVSEYVSSIAVKFYGKAGYLNFVGGLNEIAAQYTNTKYVSKTRHMGYNNQTEYITDTSKLTQTTAPWTKHTSVWNQWTSCSTSSYLCGTDESLGAGDIGYETDYNLVNSVYGTMKANNPSGSATIYWLASRRFFYDRSAGDWYFYGRVVNPDGSLDNYDLYFYGSGFGNNSRAFAVRPILTLKADIPIVSGDGKSADTSYSFE